MNQDRYDYIRGVIGNLAQGLQPEPDPDGDPLIKLKDRQQVHRLFVYAYMEANVCGQRRLIKDVAQEMMISTTMASMYKKRWTMKKTHARLGIPRNTYSRLGASDTKGTCLLSRV